MLFLAVDAAQHPGQALPHQLADAGDYPGGEVPRHLQPSVLPHVATPPACLMTGRPEA